MKIIIFGTGKRYQLVKDSLRKDIEIIAFLDNDAMKCGNMIDGVSVIRPEEIIHYTYDFVFLMSIYQKQMREQLILIGVPESKIIGDDQSERVCVSDSTKYFGNLTEASGSKKILIYTHALNSTGAQNVLYLATQVLQKNGYHIAVISKSDGILREKFVSMGAPVIIMGNPHKDNDDFSRLINWADIVFVNTVWLYYAVDELLEIGKRVIWWIHETVGFDNLKYIFINNCRQSDFLSIYAVSPLVKRRIMQAFGEDIEIGGLAYGLPRYENVNKGLLNHKIKVFAIIGAIGRIKGQDVFIQAVEKMSESYREKAEFWIVGAGRLEETDLQRAALYSCIKVIGEVSNEKMPDIYSAIDCVVCCSREEAMSVVVTEGCMNEKLVIVSDAAGNADYIIDGENGLVFECGNSRQLAELMEWVIDNAEDAIRIGTRGKEIYDMYFTMERFEHNLLKIV